MEKKSKAKWPSRPHKTSSQATEKYEAAYEYFQGLGPGRTVRQVADSLPGYNYDLLVRRARRDHWQERADVHDEELLKKVQEEDAERNKFYTRLLRDGIDDALSKVIAFDPATGKATCRLPIRGWEDMVKVTRIRDYIVGNSGRDPKDLSDGPKNYHMALVMLVESLKSKKRDESSAIDTTTVDKL